MADAPYLKSIPGDVKEVKENVAKFGSKMTELESQLTSLQANVGQIKTEVQKNSKVEQKFHIILHSPHFTIGDNILLERICHGFNYFMQLLVIFSKTNL